MPDVETMSAAARRHQILIPRRPVKKDDVSIGSGGRVVRFPRPDQGRICVKVINHFGDEVQKVFFVQGDCGLRPKFYFAWGCFSKI
jgi:hypothetical protein